MVHADGTGMRRLAVNGSNPMWSPDGKQLLFNRQNTRTNSSQLWAMDGDGSRQRCIRPLGPAYASASWSPDGTRIAGPADKGIWIVDLRTHEQHTIPWATRGWYPPEDLRWSAEGTALAAASVGKGPGPDDYTWNTPCSSSTRQAAPSASRGHVTSSGSTGPGPTGDSCTAAG
jgi:dipeptidyl aminopeptidase/acylaminoacyl peptidase